MTATGRVVAAEPGRVEVEFATPVGCESCKGTCLWRRLPDTSRATFSTALSLTRGDSVSLSLPDRFLLEAAALVYGLPLAALLAGASLGATVTGSDAGGLVGGVVGVAVAMFAVPGLRRRLEANTVKHLKLEPAPRHADADAV